MHYTFVDSNNVAYAEADVNDGATICVPPGFSALDDTTLANMLAEGIQIDMSQLQEEVPK